MSDADKRRDDEAVRLANDIERDLVATHGGPIAWILLQAKIQAASAREHLTTVDPDDSKRIRELQYEIWRQIELARWLREAVDAGEEAWLRLSDAEQRDVIDEAGLSFDDA